MNPAYSSIIDELHYGRQFAKFNGHQLAAWVLARRALGYGEQLSAEQLEQVSKRQRAFATRIISSFRGHRHELLMPRPGTDGRMLSVDVKGANVVAKRVTPHTAVTLAKPRLSLVLGGGCPGGGARS